MTYTSQYPTQDDAHVKATSKFGTDYWPYFTTDPTKSLTGTVSGNEWLSISGSPANQRFHIDLESEKIIRRIYYENAHHQGGTTNYGAKNFTLWGSNSSGSFAELTYATDTGWTQLTTVQATLDQHTGSDIVDPKYILITNSNSYRYYAFKFLDDWGNTDAMGVRRIELQTEDGFIPSSGGNASFLTQFV